MLEEGWRPRCLRYQRHFPAAAFVAANTGEVEDDGVIAAVTLALRLFASHIFAPCASDESSSNHRLAACCDEHGA